MFYMHQNYRLVLTKKKVSELRSYVQCTCSCDKFFFGCQLGQKKDDNAFDKITLNR